MGFLSMRESSFSSFYFHTLILRLPLHLNNYSTGSSTPSYPHRAQLQPAPPHPARLITHSPAHSENHRHTRSGAKLLWPQRIWASFAKSVNCKDNSRLHGFLRWGTSYATWTGNEGRVSSSGGGKIVRGRGKRGDEVVRGRCYGEKSGGGGRWSWWCPVVVLMERERERGKGRNYSSWFCWWWR